MSQLDPNVALPGLYLQMLLWCWILERYGILAWRQW